MLCRYLREKKKLKMDLTTMNQVLNLVKVYTFVPGTSREFPELAAGSGSSGSKVESTSKSISEIVTNTKIMAQFQMDHSLINKPLQLSITLPHHISTGKSDKKILFFASKEQDQKLGTEMGATLAGGDELIEKIADGSLELDFDACVATKEIFPKVIKLARFLGPKGLMPSPAKKTVSDNVEELMKRLQMSTLIQSDPEHGVIDCVVGHNSWPNKQLEDNLMALWNSLIDAKPSKVDAGKLFERFVVYGNHTPGFILPKKYFATIKK